MSNLAYTRALGTWASNQPIRSAELADLDAKSVKAPNFAEGGSYSPSSPVYVGGGGMQIKLVGANALAAGASLDCLGGSFVNVQPGGTFQLLAGSSGYVAGQLYLTAGANLDIFGAVHLQSGAGFETLVGSSFYFFGDAVSTGNFGFSGPVNWEPSSVATFRGTVNLQGAVGFTGSVAFGVKPLMLAGATMRDTVLMQGAGRVVKRTAIIATANGAAITTYGPAVCDTVFVDAMTSDTGLYIDGGVDGDEMTIVSKSSTHQLTIFDGIASIFFLKNITGIARSVRVVRVSGAWRVISAEPGNPGY